MQVKKELEKEYNYISKHVFPGFPEEYKNYVLNKTNELTQLLEKDINHNKKITTTHIKQRLNQIDTGMSNYQYDTILRLTHRYWKHSNKIQKGDEQ